MKRNNKSASNQCAEMVWHSDGMMFGNHRQCTRGAGFGPDKAYCRQHSETFATKTEGVTWYRASCFSEYSFEINAVEAVEVKDKTLLIKDGDRNVRENKETKWYRYFPTRDEAIEFYRQRIQGLRANADRLEEAVNAAAKS